MLPGLFYLALETQSLLIHNLYCTVQQRPVLGPNCHTNCHLESPPDGFVLNPLAVREGRPPWMCLRLHSTLTVVLICQKKGFDLALSSVSLLTETEAISVIETWSRGLIFKKFSGREYLGVMELELFPTVEVI